jgi:hypothetical protein
MRTPSIAALLLLVAARAEAQVAPEPLAEGEGPVPPAIRIWTDPPAELAVDGVDCGVTPAVVEVSPGRHEIVLTLWGRTYSTTVVGVPGESVSVVMRLGGGDEAARLARSRSISARRGAARRAPVQRLPWVRRVPDFPIVDVQIGGGLVNRAFEVPIDPEIDRMSRDRAALDSGVFGLLGFRVGLYPFARASSRWVRGLGVEGACAWGVGLQLRNESADMTVDSKYSEYALALAYNLIFGQPNRGAAFLVRVGWQQTGFWVSDFGNDVVPPFVYDSIRIDGGLRVPLGTPHALIAFGLAYLATFSTGAEAIMAYSDWWYTSVTTHGGEARAGLVARAGGLEVSLGWVGRFFWSEFSGIGEGWGFPPMTTRMEHGGNGIATTGPATDAINELRLEVGYRH